MSRAVAARAKAMDPHNSLKAVYQEKLKQHRQELFLLTGQAYMRGCFNDRMHSTTVKSYLFILFHYLFILFI